MIELPDLSELMLEDESPAPESAPPPADENKPKRKRRTKAQMEEAAKAHENKPDEPPAKPNGNPLPPLNLPPSVNYEQEPLPIDEPEHRDAAARVLGYQSAEQRDRILNGERQDRHSAQVEPLPDAEKVFGPEFASDVPDASDQQVLTDEMHLLREDLRDLTVEVRKLMLAVDRLREVQEAP